MECLALRGRGWVALYLLALAAPLTAAPATPTATLPPAAAPTAAPATAPGGPATAIPAAPPGSGPPVPANIAPLPVVPKATAPLSGSIGDTLPADRPITLDDAVAIAYRNHASILTAQQSLSIALGRVTEAKAGTKPTVSGNVGFTEAGLTDLGGVFGPETTGGPGSGSSSPNRSDQILSPQVAARYTIFDQGQTRLAVRSARADVRSAAAGVENALVTLGFVVTTDYFNLLRAEKLLAVNEEQVRLAQDQLTFVDARIAAGTAAQSDRAPVLTSLALARQNLVSSQNNVYQVGSVLRNSMGLPAGPTPNLADAPAPDFTIPNRQDSLVEAFRRRPDLRENQEAVNVAETNLELAHVRRLPILSTTAGLNLTPADRAQRGNWSVFTGVSMPIWDAGVTRARQQEASANLGSASALLEQARKNVAADVEQALYNMSSAKERVDASRASTEAATVALQAANARFQVGLAIPIEITSAQLDYITAENSAISALYDFYVARAQLERAVGHYRGTTGG